jgi:hypothetical protein
MTRSITRSQGFAAKEFLVSDTTCQILEERSGKDSQDLEKKKELKAHEKSMAVFISIYCICFASSNGIIHNALGYNPAFL